MKFGRTYELRISGKNAEHTFRFPTTLKFDIERNIFSSVNEGKFTIVNVNDAARKDIYLDRSLGYAEYLPVQLSAGYVSQPTVPIIFRGNVKVAYSERQGSDILTQISAFDGGFAVANGFASFTRPKGWNFVQVVTDIIKTMPHVSPGTITPQVVDNTRNKVINGASWAQLQAMAAPTGAQLFIDNEVVNLLSQKGAITDQSGIPTIQSSTGLLNIPRKIGNNILVTMILEPRIRIGNIVQLNSLLNSSVNGQYKIIGFHHYGTISGVDSGEAFTDLTLLDQKAPVNA